VQDRDSPDDMWLNTFQNTFISLQPGADIRSVEKKFAQVFATSSKDEIKKAVVAFGFKDKMEFSLQPLSGMHLDTEYPPDNGLYNASNPVYAYILSGIALFLLLIACINFINLTTARSEKRAKEVGVRKAIGSGQNQLILQFLTESVLLTLIAFGFAILFVQMALPAFNTLTGAVVKIPFSNYIFWLIALCCVLITGIVAGSRPAFYLSSFKPVKVLKGKIHTGKAATLPRKVLVVLQFSCSVALIICTYIIYQQVQYAKGRPTGYDQNRLMITDMNDDLGKSYPAIQNELIGKGIAETVTTASAKVTTSGNHRDVDDWNGKRPGETVNMGTIRVSDSYFKTLGMSMKEGRDFNLPADTLNVIFNEAAVKLLRLQNPLNETITWIDTKLRIIGVVKDALMASPFAPADPTIFFYDANPQSVIMYRLAAGIKTQDAITKLTAIFNKYNPAYPYAYSFADDSYAAKFKLEVLIGKLAGLFAGLAIFISCLGLFGLAAYIAEQRTREIGIRKVLGASVSQVWLLLSKDFILLVLISCVIASPVAFYYMQDWLQQYEYRTVINPFVFVVAGIIAVFITIITISFQAVKAAIANPVNSLRTE